jgi:hypothetical protein
MEGLEGEGVDATPPPPPAGSVTSKDDSVLFSRSFMQCCGSGSESARIRIILETWIRIRIK